jgi:Flp pilus assembly protein TadG
MTLRRFGQALGDTRGVAAIEFALIFPALFLLYVGGGEALQAYQAQRNVAHIAAAMADITAQNRTVSNTELDDALSASVSMIYPFPSDTLQQRVSSISANASGSVATDWTRSRGYSSGGDPSVPNGYLQAGESVIVADVIYDYKPTFGMFLPKSIRFVRHAYSRPRLSAKVDKVD